MERKKQSHPKGVSRRQFIAGVGSATVAAAASPVLASFDVRNPPPSQPGKGNDVQLSNSATDASGIPLGGIGAGSIEIRPDGCFHNWLIFNTGSWAPDQPEHEKNAEPEMPPSALSFFLWVKEESGKPQLRRLSTREDLNDLYNLSWAKPVEAIEFDGRFPVAKLGYIDRTLPVAVSATAFSPIIPHEAQVSGTPGFTFAFTVKNRSEKIVHLSLASVLRNPVAWGLPDRQLVNVAAESGRHGFLQMGTTADAAKKSTIGTICMSLSGGKASWIAGDTGAYLSNGGWVGGAYGNVAETFLRDFRETGSFPSHDVTHAPGSLVDFKDEDLAKMTRADKRKRIDELCQYAVADSLRKRVLAVDANYFVGPDVQLDTFLKECRKRLKGDDWGNGALCTSITLAPGEEQEIRFVLSWYFPHHFSADGPEMGHMYENWFSDAADVNNFLVANYDVHRRKTGMFADALTDTTLPGEMSLAWSSQLTTLIKSSWWIKNGRFAIWEGLGCCGLHTMDITYQGSHAIIALFPELQKAQMSLEPQYQRADGRVHHFFAPDLMHVDNGFDRVDMNPQFVMMVCRDYLWTGDKEYLAKVWTSVQRAMANTALLDADGDGLPDHDTTRNTYDQWNFFGTPAYISSLWLGALQAAAHLAQALGSGSEEERWRDLHAKAAKSFDAKLWNGEYYSLWVDKDRRDECCMSDQLSGEWFSTLMGLAPSLPKERVKRALKAVVRHNFDPEQGLINASYPPGRTPKFTTYLNGQAAANWTGIEYANASLLLEYGMVAEALAVIDAVHDRHLRTSRLWRHEECGDHYYRAMSSWATLLSATGFKVDAPTGGMTILPKVGQPTLRAPWFSSTAWGSLTKTARRLEISCRSGSMEIQWLKTNLAGSRLTVTSEGGTEVKVEKSGDGVVLRFERPIALRAGKNLTVAAG